MPDRVSAHRWMNCRDRFVRGIRPRGPTELERFLCLSSALALNTDLYIAIILLLVVLNDVLDVVHTMKISMNSGGYF